MSPSVINIKTDEDIKRKAQKIAADLGLSLSSVINGFLRQLIRDKTVVFSMDESKPSDYLLSSIKEARLGRKKGDFHSFASNKKALDFLGDKRG